jgi:DNA modification methylase
MSGNLRIEYMPLSELKKWPRNPKRHALAAIDQSYDRFGFTAPILIDEKTGLMVAGHGRVDQLVARKAAGKEPPNRILLKDGEWLVPVVRGLEFRDEKEAEAYLLADNQIAILGGFDDQILAAILKEHAINLEGLGWTAQDLETIMKRVGEPLSLGEANEPPPLPENPITQPGDFWQLDNHRILCGDSTKPEDVSRLMAGAKADSVVTDPPYGVDYSAKTEYMHNWTPWKNPVRPALINDDIENCEEFFHSFLSIMPLAEYNTVYVFMASAHFPELRRAAEKAGVTWHRDLIWVKNHFVIGPGDYHYRHEPIFYGWKGKHRYFGPRNQSTILEYGQSGPQTLHPTAKPLNLIERLVSDGSPVGGSVYDPFLGSGTTLIACENLGRVCYGMELDPRYVDVAVKRWENHTGKGRGEALLG